MVMVRLKFWSVLSCLSALLVICIESAEVKPEEIRDSILSLAKIFKDNSEKLERHEYRERQLGEQLKKALAGLDKRYRSQDQAILQLTEKIKLLDNGLGQKEVRELNLTMSMYHMLESIQGNMNTLMKELQLSAKGSTAAYTVQESPLESSLAAKLDKIAAVIESEEQSRRIIDQLTSYLEQKLSKDVRNGVDLGVKEVLKTHSTTLNHILDTTSQTAKDIQSLPSKKYIQESTSKELKEMKNTLIPNLSEQIVNQISVKVEELSSVFKMGQEDIMKVSTEIQSMTEEFNEGVSRSYQQLLKEVKALSVLDKVMMQTADNVIDTKRRIEYGVLQILLEVGELVKHQGKTLNGTVNQRFDDIETTILDNQTGALSNLSNKMETEISQVWRQIGIMYQQLTASATALDRLQQQTDTYVNGSVKIMDSMEGKVAMITERMVEADQNLNYLLGRLNLVTSEYNQIKHGLAGALDNIRGGFLEVQDKLKDIGPGPRAIAATPKEGDTAPSD